MLVRRLLSRACAPALSAALRHSALRAVVGAAKPSRTAAAAAAAARPTVAAVPVPMATIARAFVSGQPKAKANTAFEADEKVKRTIRGAFPGQFDGANDHIYTVAGFQDRLHRDAGDRTVVFITSSFCRDELSTDTAENAQCVASTPDAHKLRCGSTHAHSHSHSHAPKRQAEHFPFGGLAGVCAPGDTAYTAAAHHVPTDAEVKGVVALAGGPHISFRELSGRQIDELKALATERKTPFEKVLPESVMPGGGRATGFWGSIYRNGMRSHEGSACGAMVGCVDDLATRVQWETRNEPDPDAEPETGAQKRALTTAGVTAAGAKPTAKPPALKPSDTEQNELLRTMNEQLTTAALTDPNFDECAQREFKTQLRKWRVDFADLHEPADAWTLALQRPVRSAVMNRMTRFAVSASKLRLPLIAQRVYDNLYKVDAPVNAKRSIVILHCLAVHWNARASNGQNETALYVAVREESFVPTPPPATPPPH